MEDRLKNLNEKMNSTLLKELDFNEKRKMQVMRKIKQEDKPLRGSFISRTWKFTLSTAVSVSLCIVITFFAIEQMDLSKSGDTKPLKENITNKPATASYVPEKKEEYFGEMTKKEILTKMINTIDYFETAKGSFEERFHDNMRTVEYELSMKNPIGGFSKTTHMPKGNKNPNVEINYYDDSAIWSISKENNSYRKMGYMPTATCCTLKIDDAFSVDPEGIDMTNYRDRPPIGMAQNTLFPYEIASNYTRDLDRWEIEKQDEIVVGHNTVVIHGFLDSYASEKHSSKTFRFWVDKDTGILVKFETYNEKGDVVNYLHPKELFINIPVEISKLKPDLTNYKNQLDIEKESSSISSVSDDDIPEDIKEEWKKAKEKPGDTTVLQSNGKWYIIPQRGYLVDRIETDKKSRGTLYIVKASSQKSQHTFPVLVEGYNIAFLNIKK